MFPERSSVCGQVNFRSALKPSCADFLTVGLLGTSVKALSVVNPQGGDSLDSFTTDHRHLSS